MIDAAERALLRESVRGAIADALVGAAAGGASAAGSGDGRTRGEAGDDAAAGAAGVGAVDAALAALGWLELLDAEPGDAIEIVFTALGEAGATATALDDVLLAGLGLRPRTDVAVLLPRFAGWAPPGRVEAGEVAADGLASARLASARELLVVCAAGGELQVAAVPVARADARAVQGIDPAAGLRAVHLRARAQARAGGAATARGGAPRGAGADGAAAAVESLATAAWDGALALGRRAVAHQVAGACRAMLGLATAHARERVQFGRPIARFQAVRHRLADALVAIEALEATLDAAADEPGVETAALAKAAAGRAARTAGAHCQQVLAGIGFTTDHAFHRFLKRTMLLEGLFGSADEIVSDLGRRLLASRSVPTLVELRGSAGVSRAELARRRSVAP